MRIHKTEKQIKEVDVTIEDYHVCDKCNKKVNHANSHMYDAFYFGLTYKEGEEYPDNGGGYTHELELCQPCAKGFLKLLTDNAYRVSTTEWDY